MSASAKPAVELFGRAHELALLDEALEGARHGRGSLVVVSGEAGRGKSALVAEAGRRAAASGFELTLGRAWEFADAPPWFALRACLRSLGIEPGATPVEASGGAFLLWESVLEALARTTTRSPVLWVIEDVHAADVATLDLLVFLAQPLTMLHAVVIVTTRPDDPRLSDPMLDRLTRMARDGLDLRLEPLAAENVARLARAIVHHELPNALVDELVERSGGNPLFAVEYARAIRGAHGNPGALAMLPTTLRQVTLERARFLPVRTLATLRAASVVGREFSAAMVGRMLGVAPASAIDTLLPALKIRLIQEADPGHFRFSHALVRDALYESNDPAERARLHAQAAETFAPGSSSDDLLIERVQHALSGLPVTDAAATAELATRAVASLEARQASDRAFALHARLQEARRAGFLPAQTADDLLESARLAQAAGRFDESKRATESVIALARTRGDAALLARSALQLGSALTPGLVDATLIAVLREALEGLAETEAGLGCLVLARLAAALQPAPDPMMPVALAREAITKTRALGDTKLLVEVLFYAGSALVDFAPLPERIEAAEELFELSEQLSAPTRALQAAVRLALDHATAGDFARFDAALESAERLSQILGHAPRYRWRPLMLRSMRASMQGDFVESERILVELRELYRQYGERAFELALRTHELLVKRLWRQDDYVRSQISEIGKWLSMPGWFPIVAMVRASLHARLGEREAAVRAFEIAAPHIDQFALDPDFCAFAAEAAAVVGSPDTCRTLLVSLRRHERRECVMGQVGMTYEGPSGRAVGLLETALGRHETALGELRAALELTRVRGQRPYVAQIGFEIGLVLGKLGREAEAREYFERAQVLATELGMTGLVAALEGRLASTPAAAASAVAAAEAPTFSLAAAGNAWRCCFRDRVFFVKASRGIGILARLVERPADEIHALVLAADDGEPIAETSSGAQLDEQAVRAYRARLRELAEEVDEAELVGDRGRFERLSREREALVAELSRAVGLGGRQRKAGSATERARVNVQKRLKDAVVRIGEVDPEAGHYLGQALRTGSFCSFRP